MKGAIRLFKLKLFIAVNVALYFSVSPAMASAGWYPTAQGESLTVEYCLPTAIPGTLYLQALGSGTNWKTVAVIKSFRHKYLSIRQQSPVHPVRHVVINF